MNPSTVQDGSIALQSAPISTASLLIFLVLNLFLGLSAFLWTRRFFGRQTLSGSIMVFLTLYFAQVVLVFTVLGLLGALGLGYMSLGIIMMFILTLACLWKRWSLLEHMLSLARGKRRPEGRDRPLWLKDYYFLVLLALVLVLFFQGLVIALSLPPNAWGALNYHLTFPTAWMKSGRIEVFSFPLGDHADSFSPSNIEFFYLLLLSPLKSDLLAKVGQLAFLLLGALALYALARELGIGRKAALFPPLFFALTLGIFRQAFTAEIDVAFAALLITFYYFWLSFERKVERRWLVLAGLSFGLFLGTKYVAVPFAPWMLLPFFVSIFRPRSKPNYLKNAIVNLFLFFAVAGIFGGFWYIRNLALTGSPIYPASVKVFGTTIFPGAFAREAMLTSEFHLTQVKDLLRILVEGCGAPFLLLAIAGTFWAIVKLLLRDRQMWATKIYFFVTPLVLGAVFWWGIPYNSEVRFLYGPIALSFLPLGYLLAGRGSFAVWLKRVILVVFVFNTFKILPAFWFDSLPARPPGLVAGGFYETASLIFSSVVAFLCLFLLGKEFAARTRFWRLRAVSYVLVAAIIIMTILFPYFVYPPEGEKLPRRTILYNALFHFAFGEIESKMPLDLGYVNYNFYFLGWGWVSRNIHGQRIAFTGYNLPYFLFGRDLTNEVFYVNVNKHLNWKFHQYDLAEREKPDYLPPSTNKPGYHRRERDVEAWLSNLREQGVDYLFVTRVEDAVAKRKLLAGGETFPVERGWAEERPSLFTLVHPVGEIPNPFVRIYKVNIPPQAH